MVLLTSGVGCSHHLAARFKLFSRVRCLGSSEGLTTGPWDRLKRSLVFELEKGCIDYKGKHQFFSDYAQIAIKELDPPADIRTEHSEIVAAFKSYSGISESARKELVNSSLGWIEKWSSIMENADSESKETIEYHSGHPDSMSPGSAPTIVHGGDGEENELDVKVYGFSDNLLKGLKTSLDTPKKVRRPIRASTEERQLIFQECSKYTESDYHQEWASTQAADQGSVAWKNGRRRRLTASSFGAVLGLLDRYDNDTLVNLWKEKIGVREPFAGNRRTAWGSKMESTALKEYQVLTSIGVSKHGLKFLKEDHAHSWMGGSPDGIINNSDDMSKQLPTGHGDGMLEIKCPYGSHPSTAVPAPVLQDYYYPQVQGLMDIFDVEWCHLISWTKNNGIHLFFVPRNREYWTAAYTLLSEFWWANVVPARLALDYGSGDTSCYTPSPLDPRRDDISKATKEITSAIKPITLRREG